MHGHVGIFYGHGHVGIFFFLVVILDRKFFLVGHGKILMGH